MDNSTIRGVLTITLLAWSVSIPAAAQDQRGWVDVNFGLATSIAEETSYAYAQPLFGETAGFAVTYPQPSRGASFDFGGGYMFTPVFGLGGSFAGTGHTDTAGLGASIPHPFFFSSFGTAGAETDEELTRTEGAFHIHAMIAPVHTERLRIRVFGGPSFFRYRADMVDSFLYLQNATRFSPVNNVSITTFDTVEVEGDGIGFHVGGDASFFFTRVFGLGGFARFSRGDVTIDEPFTLEEEEVRVGGLQFGGGIRLRF